MVLTQDQAAAPPFFSRESGYRIASLNTGWAGHPIRRSSGTCKFPRSITVRKVGTLLDFWSTAPTLFGPALPGQWWGKK